MKRLLVGGIAALTIGLAGKLTLSPSLAADPSWTMPDLVGVDLQGAQDTIQSLTDGEAWYSGATDLTGQGRAQDCEIRNWVVCSSNASSGRRRSAATTNIDFGVVRDTRSVPVRVREK